MFSQRVAHNQAQNRSGTFNNMSVPSPLPIQTSTPLNTANAVTESGLTSPNSAMASRFNVKAMEFKPNPSASSFTPAPSASEAPSSKRQSTSTPSVASVAGTFFANGEKPSAATLNPSAGAFNPLKRMAENSDDDRKAMYATNGGIPQPYRTPPVFDIVTANQDKSYVDMFSKAPNTPSMAHVHPGAGGVMPHQHQLPLHLQNGPPPAPGQQTPRFYAAHPQHGPNQHLDDQQRMQYSSSNSSVQPSPRMGHPMLAYNGQMHPQMQGYHYGMPAAVSPAMQMRPMPAGGPYMGQQPPMGGQFMVHQGSNGPYMNGPAPQQMPMYSPGPGHAQGPYGGHSMQHQNSSGYSSSPRGHAMSHTMSHQGSQQGHNAQQMYMMPQQGQGVMMPPHSGPMTPMRNFAQSQYPMQHAQNPYGMQHRTMSGGGYPPHQMTPRQQHAMPQPGQMSGMPPQGQMSAGDEGK